MGSILQNLAKIQQALHTNNSNAAAILIGASKTQPEAVLREALNAGLVHFGENKIQEAQRKWPALRAEYPNMVLHGIGPIQSNKAADALALFDVIHTIDRPKLVQALASARDKGISIAGKQFLIQVNTGEEPQKAGVIPAELPALLEACSKAALPISGLMCIPPEGTPAAPHFALLRKLAVRHELYELSMGMSADYALAATMGATMVRVGTLLFGARET